MTAQTFTLDGVSIPFTEGQTIIEAARSAGVFIPFLCAHPEFPAHGSCRVCTVLVNGRSMASCTTKAAAGHVVESNTPALNRDRQALVQMLLVEGNHFCPGCEHSGHCRLQATAYAEGITSLHFESLHPNRPIDASHPQLMLDLNRCILCGLCVRASEREGKSVFALGGHGLGTHLVVNSASGRLADTSLSTDDQAAHICPVGVFLHKGRGFAVPIGQRPFDTHPIDEAP